MQKIGFAILISALWFAVGCGGSSSNNNNNNNSNSAIISTPGSNTVVAQGAANVAPLTVDAGPASIANSNNSTINYAYTTVTVCPPNGGTPCVTIDHVQVDTGSIGLKILSSAVTNLTNGPQLLAKLPNVSTTSSPVAECYPFVLNYVWGGVHSADVKMGGLNNAGEVATAVPILVMDDSSIPSTAPTSCTANAVGSEMTTVAELGANGLIGVGNYQYDCDFPGAPTGIGSGTYGIGAANPCSSTGVNTTPPDMYYTCSGSTCTASLVPATQQIRNPVSMFTGDNNGVILELPTAATGVGAATASGALVFGIGTESNNAMNNNDVVLPIDLTYADPAWLGVTTVFNGTSYPNANSTTSTGSYLDSGSNAIFFLDAPTTGITDCPTSYDYFYCPKNTETFTALNESTSGSKSQFQFNVSDATTLLSGSYTAFSDLTGPNTAGTGLNSSTELSDQYFAWGLPFFYGRNVYTSIWGMTQPSGVPAAPWWSY